MRALVLGNDGDHDPGFIGARAAFHGYNLEFAIREDPSAWPSLVGFDLVLSLGSEWSVYWDHVQGQVEPEIALLQAAHRRDIPVFGICFGSQLLATAHGGCVARSTQPEIGWFGVEPTVAGMGLVDPGPWFQWHDDRWTLPPGAMLLAKNDAANQAFSIGRTFATQFHPELTDVILKRWMATGGASIMAERGIDADGTVDRTHAIANDAESRANALFDRFLSEVVR
jgi:GMP synthase-like glutamine amidotransferase